MWPSACAPGHIRVQEPRWNRDFFVSASAATPTPFLGTFSTAAGL